ncbi:hypothetical protein [Streptomyces phaeochromogenes]|uniref:hypothetical protein n=1 Tax=Streptomyces phaeochromogenes TaxID=1923 RepID=UPI00340D27FE
MPLIEEIHTWLRRHLRGPPDLVDCDFSVSGPDRLLVADMACVRTWLGWAYAVFVLGVYPR